MEPDSEATRHALSQLPGVISLETFRSAAVRLRFGHRRRQLVLRGMPSESLHERVIDTHNRVVPLPPDGIVIVAAVVRGYSIGRSGHLRVPAVLCHRCRLYAGTRVLVVVHRGPEQLEIHPPASVEAMLYARRRTGP